MEMRGAQQPDGLFCTFRSGGIDGLWRNLRGEHRYHTYAHVQFQGMHRQVYVTRKRENGGETATVASAHEVVVVPHQT